LLLFCNCFLNVMSLLRHTRFWSTSADFMAIGPICDQRYRTATYKYASYGDSDKNTRTCRPNAWNVTLGADLELMLNSHANCIIETVHYVFTETGKERKRV
jgi:hypothetical protein